MYEKMAAQITAATLVLKNQATAAEDIDRILTTMMVESRPVYVGLSVDVGYLEVDNARLKTPLSTELPPNDKSLEADAVAELIAYPDTRCLTARRHGSQQPCRGSCGIY